MKHLFQSYFFFIFSVFISNYSISQETLESLKRNLDAHPQKDSLRCILLNYYIDAQNDDLIWPAYNEELYQIATEKLKQKLSKSKFLFFLEMQCIAINNQSYVFLREGKIEEALQSTKEALKKALKYDLDNSTMLLYSALSEYYNNKGDYLTMLFYSKKSLAVAEKLNEGSSQATLLSNISYTYGQLGLYKEEAFYLTKGIELAKKYKNYESLGSSYISLAENLKNQGEIDKALFYTYKSLELAKKKNYVENVAYGYRFLGMLYFRYDQFDKAKEYLIKSIEISKKIKNKSMIGLSYIDLGNLFFTLSSTNKNKKEKGKQLKIANYYFKKAIELHRSINYNSGLSYAINKYGVYLLHIEKITREKGKIQEATKIRENAKQLFNEALVLDERMSDFEFLSESYNQLAKIALIENDVKTAAFYANKSYALLDKIGDKPNFIQNTASALKDIFAKQKDFKRAYEMSELNFEMTNKVYNLENKTKVVKADFKIKQQEKELRINQLRQKNQLIHFQSERKNLYIAIGIGFFVSLSIFAFFQFNRYKQRKENQLLTQQFKDAQLLLETERKVSESEIKAIKSQMNPHFFYNALNSIQGYVLTGEKHKASESIGLFSDLSRSILESSRHKEISLADELELLESYLRLEQMRLSKIAYKFLVAENVPTYDCFIPPMILQPIIENSVKHGLSNKTEGGTITIEMLYEGENLKVIIDDDGIGREASANLNRFKKKPSSFSSEANLNRIELLNEIHDLKIEQVIIDKKEDGEPCGTRIELVFPQNVYA